MPSRGVSKANEADWSKADFQAKLEESFQKNDPCAVLDLLHRATNVAPSEFWSSGMAVLLNQSKNEALLELLTKPNSPLYGQTFEDPKTPEARFFNALSNSGQLHAIDVDEEAHRHGPRNLEKAIETFKALAQENPENGAYSFFLAGALRQNGANKEEVHAAFSAAAKASHFDPFFQHLFDELTTVAYSNAAAFTWVYSFLESGPAPDYEIGTRYLKFWAHSEEPGKWVAHKIAKHLVDIGTSYKTNSPGYQFSRNEYLLGQNLKYTVDGTMEKSWEEYSNKMKTAQNFISEIPKPVKDSEINLYRERIEAKPNCGPDAWKSLFAAYKAKKEET
jgi:hypothetical protein